MTVPPAAPDPRFAQVQAEILDRAPEHSPQPSLERVQAVLELLGDPHRAYPVVHVTGTNGKTSTARMVDRLLREHGLRTGRFTSPHLSHVGERITVDGVRLDEAAFVAAWDDVAPYVELVDARSLAEGGPRLSFFEVLTCMAFAVFADAPVDVAVVEVGLGGTWDSTNVVDAAVAVVTPVALDHERWLGHDLVSIATQKGGIVKAGSVLVTAQQPLEVAEVLLRRAQEVGAVVAREGLEFGVLSRDVAVGGQRVTLKGLVGGADDVYLPLHGAHQAGNAATAVAAVEALLGSGGDGGTGLDPDLVRDAFAHVDAPGRMEPVRRGPLVVVDAAHNPAGAEALVAGLEEAFPGTRLVGVLGVMADKDAAAVLDVLEPHLEEVVVTTAPSPRALPADDLAAAAREVLGEDRVHLEPRLADALDRAVGLADAADPAAGVASGVVVTGSVLLVAHARTLLGAPDPDAVALDTTSRGVSVVATDTERQLLGDDWADPGDDRYDAPDDSALLDDLEAFTGDDGDDGDDVSDDAPDGPRA